jgi:Cu+-exporting ATPase
MAAQELLLKVEGMTCNNCAAGISKSLQKAGFKDVDASFIDGEVSFTLLEGRSPQTAIDNIESLGYKVKVSALGSDRGLAGIEKKFLISLIFTVPLFMHMFVPNDWWLNNPLVQIALCLPVYSIGFMHFGKSAWGSLKAGVANMDVLIFMGSTAAFLYSLAGTWMYWGSHEIHGYMFFETTATIITLVLLGNVLEHRSVQQTTQNLGELTKMQAQAVARIVMRVGQKEKIFETEPKNVKIGDELQINEGDHVPVDGLLLSGDALVDESAITGESGAVQKQPGDTLYSGTLLLSGNARIEASQAAKDSTLQKIIDLVKKARRDQPNIQVLGDKVSGIFVPVVLVIAAVTFGVWHWIIDIGLSMSLMNAVAVLVISCPCAMGLATPTAVVAGVGRAAKNGILIKGGSTLESFAQARTIIFDKTGTLTSGHFAVSYTHNSLGSRADALIKALEQHSSHPIARALTAHFAEAEAATLHEVQEIKGQGMQGLTANGQRLSLGKSTPGTHSEADLLLRLDGVVVAGLRIRDSIKPGAYAMVALFQSEGFHTVLLSGDRKEKVEDTAQTLGIEEVHYAMSPQQKLEYIEVAAAIGTVAMVGDGINDGPALSRAQVGISPGGASALAIDSARVVLMGSKEMEALGMSFKLSKHTYLTIKQNLFWAFAYNVVAIPLAAAGLLNPMVAALVMAFSDVVVIGNSLRLKVKKLN